MKTIHMAATIWSNTRSSNKAANAGRIWPTNRSARCADLLESAFKISKSAGVAATNARSEQMVKK
jgi:hypothetical protein